SLPNAAEPRLFGAPRPLPAGCARADSFSARFSRRDLSARDVFHALTFVHCARWRTSWRWAYRKRSLSRTPPSRAFSVARDPLPACAVDHSWWLRQMAIYGRAERRNVSRIILKNRTYQHGPSLALADARCF